MRIARVGDDAIVLYDRHAPIDIDGCGRGRCSPLHLPAQPSGVRYSVIRFWGMELCPNCGRTFGYARADQTLYRGNSLQDATITFAEAEGLLLG
jgi:hypothetical protein